jgi:hypothetical protein
MEQFLNYKQLKQDSFKVTENNKDYILGLDHKNY